MSAKIVRACMKYCDHFMSFKAIHKLNNRATPEKIIIFRHALMLHKIFNSNDQTTQWVNLNINQVLTSGQTNLKLIKLTLGKLGSMLEQTVFSILNDKIPLSLLNLEMDSFKTKKKSMLLC